MLKEKQKKALVGVFIVFIMIFSVFGFVMNYSLAPAEDQQYGDHIFKQVQEGFVTSIDGKEYLFYMLPQDVENYPIEGNTSEMEEEMISVTYNPKSTYAQSMAEAQFLLETGTDTVIERGLTNSTGTQLRQITCENTDNTVIQFKESDETLIDIDGRCITVNFVENYDLFGQVEKIRYILLGVL